MSTAAKLGSRRSFPRAVSDENQSVWASPTVPEFLTGERDDDDVKQPNDRGWTPRKATYLQPLQSHAVLSVSQTGPFHRSISTESELSDVEFDLRPLIKEELRNNIKERRRESGLLDWALEDYDKKMCRDYQLTEEDIMKREDRKARNRLAAAKCRQKRRKRVEELQETMEALENRRNELIQQRESLSQEKQKLERMVEDHFRLCPRGKGLRAT